MHTLHARNCEQRKRADGISHLGVQGSCRGVRPRRPCRLHIFRAMQRPVDGPSNPSRPSLFPAGRKQARVEIPAFFVFVSPYDVETYRSQIEAIVEAGATGIVLEADSSIGSGTLYEAAISLKQLVRGRTPVLVFERMDIADAASVDGILLSEKGLPTVLAKDLVQNGAALIGRIVGSGAAAVASAAEGVNFVVMRIDDSLNNQNVVVRNVQEAVKQRSGASVPVIVDCGGSLGSGQLIESCTAAGAAGIGTSLAEILTVANKMSVSEKDAAMYLYSSLMKSQKEDTLEAPQPLTVEGAQSEAHSVGQLSQLLNNSREALAAKEKDMLKRLEGYLELHCRQLEEASLLKDAILQLDELFLLVVVGEFNSGKSAVINALLGRRVLAEGILPTTNEITVLKWAPSPEDERTEQTSDGLFIRYIPADLLKEVNIVDTPGTNVILDRQQRLTEEFVPRADLVLFVMSADRPFTESEVRFLRYIREWGKKIVFVVNKSDLLVQNADKADVAKFVSDNAVRLLGVDKARVVPVSARMATEAKLNSRKAEKDLGTGALSAREENILADDPLWQASGFDELESFMRDFLIGGTELGGESARIKLQTPLFVAEALVSAASSVLTSELEVVQSDADSVRLVRSQLESFKLEMRKEGALQRDEVAKQLAGLVRKASSVIDVTLTLSNWDVLSTYIMGPNTRGGRLPVAMAYREQVPQDAVAQAMSLVREHTSWLGTNCSRQLESYKAFATARAQTLGLSFSDLVRNVTSEEKAEADIVTSLSTVESRLSPGETEAMLEQEVREAVLSTASIAASAAGLGVILTSVLPTTLEDLLALGLSAAVGYASLLNLPLRRAEAKKKLETLVASATVDVQAAMEKELEAAITDCEARILRFIGPLESLMIEEVERADEALQGLNQLSSEIDELKEQVARLS